MALHMPLCYVIYVYICYDIDHVSAFLLVGEPLALDKLLRRREKFAKGGFSIQGIISLLLKYFVFHVIF